MAKYLLSAKPNGAISMRFLGFNFYDLVDDLVDRFDGLDRLPNNHARKRQYKHQLEDVQAGVGLKRNHNCCELP